jgi:SIR2-like domain
VLAIIGAGVSMAATANNVLASWRGLLVNGVQRCLATRAELTRAWADRVLAQIDGDIVDLLCAAENISQRLGAPAGGEYARWLEDTVGSLNSVDPAVIDAVKRLGVPIMTTNYDDVIEKTIGLREVTWKEPYQVISFAQGRSDVVLHLHGHWRFPDSVILGIRSYEDVLRDPKAQNALRAFMTFKTLVFIGFGSGLKDPNFGALLHWASSTLAAAPSPSFHLCCDGDRLEVQAQHEGSRIYPLPYGGHADLAGYLEALR